MRFSVVFCGAKSRVVSISLSSQGRAYNRAQKSEKSSSLIPVGGGGACICETKAQIIFAVIDQGLCFCFLDTHTCSTILLLSKSEITSLYSLAIFCNCTAWFVETLNKGFLAMCLLLWMQQKK